MADFTFIYWRINGIKKIKGIFAILILFIPFIAVNNVRRF